MLVTNPQTIPSQQVQLFWFRSCFQIYNIWASKTNCGFKKFLPEHAELTFSELTSIDFLSCYQFQSYIKRILLTSHKIQNCFMKTRYLGIHHSCDNSEELASVGPIVTTLECANRESFYY